MLQLLAPLCLFLLPQSEDAAARRAAVERQLLPSPWVEGHGFSLEERMAQLNVPGLSVAVLHEGKLDWAAGYGLRDARSGAPVTSETLFQAGSISKPVAAMAAHRLAQEGLLDLDAPINSVLKSWQLPRGEFEGEVSARQILSHMGGLAVHGFGGYASFDPAPSVLQVLDGLPPTNSEPVRRIEPQGRRPRYSGGGSTILQLALADLSGSDFTSLLSSRVLSPLKMTRSTFAQPLPVERWPDHAAGHGEDGRPIAGGFRVHPEQFAAGLWTTATDLARFAQELQNALQFDAGKVLGQQAARGMLSEAFRGMGLGVMLSEHEGERWFGHGGSNMGFKNDFQASFEGGRGVFILTNGDQGSVLAQELTRAVARVYGWPAFVEPGLAGVSLDEAARQRFCGRYGSEPDQVIYVTQEAGQLYLQENAAPRRLLAPLGEARFLVLGSQRRIEFEAPSEKRARGLRLASYGTQLLPRLEAVERWPLDDLREGTLEAALIFYLEVHEADPSDPMVSAPRLGTLADNLWRDGRLEAGVALAELATELYGTQPEAWFRLAEMRASTEQKAGAIEAYRQCLALLPEAQGGWLRDLSRSMLGHLGG